MRNRLCPICRTSFSLDMLIALKPSITQITRTSESWKATVVDVLRYPLDDKVMYHECGEFFNLSSVKELYQVTRRKNFFLFFFSPFFFFSDMLLRLNASISTRI